MNSALSAGSATAVALDRRLRPLSPQERLVALRSAVPGRLVFTTSFGLEDQAITHMIAAAGVDVAIATLDTGRLFPETYALWAQTEARYGINVAPYYPQASDLEALVAAQGIDGFYAGVAARKACCDVRKLRPLRRALNGASGWITGLRADQSERRQSLACVSMDEARGLIKLNPIVDWTRADVAAFTASEGVPVSPLHDKGFLSIGCAPCTRAVAPDQPERSGRWWWEGDPTKECGLHLASDGRFVPDRGPVGRAAP